MAKLYGIPAERISDFVEYDPGYAIKFTIYRLQPSGTRETATFSGRSSTHPCWTWRFLQMRDLETSGEWRLPADTILDTSPPPAG